MDQNQQGTIWGPDAWQAPEVWLCQRCDLLVLIKYSLPDQIQVCSCLRIFMHGRGFGPEVMDKCDIPMIRVM